MKKLSAAVIGLAILIATAGPVGAHQINGLNGLLLGSAGGAIFGQALAGTTQSIVVGSIVGGTLGMLVELNAPREQVVVIGQPRPQPRVAYVYSQHRDYRVPRDGRREHHRSGRPGNDSWRHRR